MGPGVSRRADQESGFRIRVVVGDGGILTRTVLVLRFFSP